MVDETYAVAAGAYHKTEAAFVPTMDAYHQMYKESLEHPDRFWLRSAKELLSWDRPPTIALAGYKNWRKRPALYSI